MTALPSHDVTVEEYESGYVSRTWRVMLDGECIGEVHQSPTEGPWQHFRVQDADGQNFGGREKTLEGAALVVTGRFLVKRDRIAIRAKLLAPGAALPSQHGRAKTPGWDTKVRCLCGAEFNTLREFNRHVSTALPSQGDAR